MAEKRERNKTRGMLINAAQKQAAGMDYKRPGSTTAQQLQQELELTDREVNPNLINSLNFGYFQRHQQMQKFLSSSMQGEESLQRRRPGQQHTDRQVIAAQTEGKNMRILNKNAILALRQSPGDSDTHTDELFDGVVRTVTAQADSRDQSRRRARQFNRKSCECDLLNSILTRKFSEKNSHDSSRQPDWSRVELCCFICGDFNNHFIRIPVFY
jgi:hypothetical protein